MITHSKVSAKADGADNSLIQPTDWNDEHVIADGYMLMQKASVTLTHAQILTLPSTPVNIIAAPGAGKVIVPINGVFSTNIDAGAYTNTGATFAGYFMVGNTQVLAVPKMADLIAMLNNTSQTLSLVPSAGSYKATDPEVTQFVAQEGDLKPVTSYGAFSVNQPLRFLIDNYDVDYSVDQGDLTGGHADNYMNITVIYHIMDI